MTPEVSRETPAPPRVAAAIFGDELARAQDFASFLARDGVERGFLGPGEVDRIWHRHLVNCAVVVDAVPHGSRVADVGSGAGLPGLVWALCRPDLVVTLIEPMLRRVRFLTEAAEHLALPNVEIVRARAEELHGARTFDLVTARAVAPMERLARWCIPLLRPGGTLVAFKGDRAQDELREASSTMRRLGATEVRVETYGVGVTDSPTRVVVMVTSRGPGESE